MSIRIRKVQYYYVSARNSPGQAYQILSYFARQKINLQAFSITPAGSEHTRIMLYPNNAEEMERAVTKLGVEVTGPHWSFLVQGDDELGMLAQLHHKLADAEVNVFTSSGVTDGEGRFGYLLYVSAEDFEKAERALGI